MKAIASVPANYAAEGETGSVDLSARQSLRRMLDLNGWLDSRRAAEIALDVVKALYQAHRRGVQHVKLQPDSIFLSNDGDIVIADEAVEAAPRTRAQYLSPEETRGEKPDSRSQFYALGIVLYEMLTDRVPFDGNDVRVIKLKHLTRTPEPPQVFRSDIPDALSALVMRLLEKDPAMRPQRATELCAELQKIIDAPSVAAPEPGLVGAAGNKFIVDIDSAPDLPNGSPIGAVDAALLGLESSDTPVTEVPTSDEIAASELLSKQSDAPIVARPMRPNAEEFSRSPIHALATVERNSLVPSPITANKSRVRDDASSLSAQIGLGAETKNKDVTGRPANSPLRRLALLLIAIVAASGLLLYKAGRPIVAASKELATPSVSAHTFIPSAPVYSALPPSREFVRNPRQPITNLSPETPADTPQHRTSSKAARSLRPASVRTVERPTRARVTRTYRAQPAPRAKRRWIRRILHF